MSGNYTPAVRHVLSDVLLGQEEEYRKAETPAEKLAEKLRQQKILEEADLHLAIEAFGAAAVFSVLPFASC